MLGIIGPGALGHMLGFFLKKSQAELAFQMLAHEGPRVITAKILWQGQEFDLKIDQTQGLCDTFIVLVKSYHLTEAMQQHLPRLHLGGTVILLGNGYLEPLLAPYRSARPDITWRKGLVTWGVKRDENDRYSLSPSGTIVWGGPGAPSSTEGLVLAALRDYGGQWAVDACDRRKAKWFCNTVLNTLCGAYRLPSNGAAWQLFRQDLEALSTEVYRLGREIWPEWTASKENLGETLRRLIEMTADNENSMARDLRLGRQTEADVLSGCLSLSAVPSRYSLLSSFHERVSQTPTL